LADQAVFVHYYKKDYMLYLLKQNKTYHILFPVIIALLLWGKSFMFPVYQDLQITAMPLFQMVSSWFNIHSLGGNILAFALLLIAALQIVKLNSEFRFSGNSSFLPAGLFLILASSHPSFQQLLPVHFSLLFILYSFDNLFVNLIQERRKLNTFFDSFFALSIGSLFYFPAIYVALFLWICMLSFNEFYWRSWLISLLGIITPYFAVFVYYFWNDSFLETYSALLPNIDTPSLTLKLSMIQMASYGFTLMLFVVSIIVVFNGAIKKYSTRKYLGLFLLLCILQAVVFTVSFQMPLMPLVIIAIPLSFYLGNLYISINQAVFGEMLFSAHILLFILNLVSK